MQITFYGANKTVASDGTCTSAHLNSTTINIYLFEKNSFNLNSNMSNE